MRPQLKHIQFIKSTSYIKESNVYVKKIMLNKFNYQIYEQIIKYYQKQLGLKIEYKSLSFDEYPDSFYITQRTPVLSLPTYVLSNKQCMEVQYNINEIVKTRIYEIYEELIVANGLDNLSVFCIDVSKSNCFVHEDKNFLLDLEGFVLVGYKNNRPVSNLTSNVFKLARHRGHVSKHIKHLKKYMFVVE